MKSLNLLTLTAVIFLCIPQLVLAQHHRKTGVIVSIVNAAPDDGTFQTPIWVGFHDGTFDIYDRDAPASALPISGSVALERLAEDGNTGPISDDFSTVVPDGVQATVFSNVADRPPFGPGDRVARLFRLDPAKHKYFSYGSMVIPSNDAFIANGNPLAHPIFNSRKRFVARGFKVLGNEVLDAGTEVNDEIPENTAFFGQMAPNTGVDEDGTVVLHPGFLPASSGGILADPMFAGADFLQPGYKTVRFHFRRVNLNRPNRFNGFLTTRQETTPPDVDRRRPFGVALTSTNSKNNKLNYLFIARRLSGRPTAIHFHVGQRGQDGPVSVDVTESAQTFFLGGFLLVSGQVNADDIVGPLSNGEAPFDNFFGELATRGIYINIHTERNPAGELRAQLY